MDFTKKMRETCNFICIVWLVSIHPFIHWTLLGVNCLFHTVGGVETWGLWDREELSYQVNTVFIILLTFDGRTKMPWLDCIISEMHRHRYGYIGDQMDIYIIKWTLTYTWLQLSGKCYKLTACNVPLFLPDTITIFKLKLWWHLNIRMSLNSLNRHKWFTSNTKIWWRSWRNYFLSPSTSSTSSSWSSGRS